MRRVLFMCRPDYFGIEYEINPWMSLNHPADRGRAKEQWESLYHFLTESLKLEVRLIDPVKGLPDMCFTANAGLAWDNRFICSSFRNAQRRPESRYFHEWFEKNGFMVYNLSPELFFEGEGDILFADETDAYAGYLIRSDVKSHTAIADLLNLRIVSLELVDPRFYHLDTCLCPLNAERIVYYPGAFDAYARKAIEVNFPDRIEVTQEEAAEFVCNALIVGDNYIQPKGGAKSLRPALESRGYNVHQFDMSEFIKAGGAVKCLVLNLWDTTDGKSESNNWGSSKGQGVSI